jgi:hypothetical protein
MLANSFLLMLIYFLWILAILGGIGLMFRLFRMDRPRESFRPVRADENDIVRKRTLR